MWRIKNDDLRYAQRKKRMLKRKKNRLAHSKQYIKFPSEYIEVHMYDDKTVIEYIVVTCDIKGCGAEVIETLEFTEYDDALEFLDSLEFED